MSEHTKTPWKVTGGHYVDAPIGDARLQEVAYCGDCEVGNQRDNALYIVHCVNNHERLVRMVQRLADECELHPVPDGLLDEARTLLAQLQADKGG